MQKSILVILLLLFFACSTNPSQVSKSSGDTAVPNTFPIKPLLLIADNGDDEGGWGADIRLSLIEIIQNDSFTTYKAVSSYNSKNIGLDILLSKHLKGFHDIITFKSAGQISNYLLEMLTELYKLKASNSKQFITNAKADFIDLNEFAKDAFGKYPVGRTESKQLKIFIESKNPDDNAELYLNINEKEHWLEINEKDEEYRRQIIRFLTAH